MRMNVPKYDRIAREIFAPAYVAIAEMIKEKTGVTEGVCLDVGTGGGYLGIALARITNLDVLLLDSSREMLHIALPNIIEGGLETRVRILFGDVHKIPINDGSVNLVISRGSVFFWKDKAQAFTEIYRVLAPGGRAYIGGGLGTPDIQKQIKAKMKKLGRAWPGQNKKNGDHQEEYRKALQDACITNSSVTRSEVGLWIEIWK
ncbi:MAG: SAM-dependent methyltransferase [Syntrophus sp. (in: bacteria)]|nr:SAM-dependent methyltransferase [Syntrophus sp. (in: bacteria)]